MTNESCIRQQADVVQLARCRERLVSVDDKIGSASQLMSLAGNSVRLKILYLLYQEGRLCVCDLSDILDMTISAVSQHLKRLKLHGLVRTERDAQTIYYSLNTGEQPRLLSIISMIEAAPEYADEIT